jgi:hypothetical protein
VAKKPKAIVLDSWAVIACLEGEASAEKVADIIADAHEEAIPLLMTVVNAGEVWYIVARETSIIEAESSVKQLRDLGIEFCRCRLGTGKERGAFQVSKQNVFRRLLCRSAGKKKRKGIWPRAIRNSNRSKRK